MILSIADDLIAHLVPERSYLAVPFVLAVGFVSTLKNPCAIPLYPAATAACVTQHEAGKDSAARARFGTLGNAMAFLLGVALSIASLGLAAAGVGHLIGIGRWGRYLIALIPVFMGMQRLGWLPANLFKFHVSNRLRPGLGGAFTTGLVLSIVLAGCGSAVLGSLLAYAAYRRAFLYGGVLLFAYGLGAGIPLVTLGKVIITGAHWFERRGLQRWTTPLLGYSMLAAGVYLFWLA